MQQPISYQADTLLSINNIIDGTKNITKKIVKTVQKSLIDDDGDDYDNQSTKDINQWFVPWICVFVFLCYNY